MDEFDDVIKDKDAIELYKDIVYRTISYTNTITSQKISECKFINISNEDDLKHAVNKINEQYYSKIYYTVTLRTLESINYHKKKLNFIVGNFGVNINLHVSLTDKIFKKRISTSINNFISQYRIKRLMMHSMEGNECILACEIVNKMLIHNSIFQYIPNCVEHIVDNNEFSLKYKNYPNSIKSFKMRTLPNNIKIIKIPYNTIVINSSMARGQTEYKKNLTKIKSRVLVIDVSFNGDKSIIFKNREGKLSFKN
jgi:hypothetical protein